MSESHTWQLLLVLALTIDLAFGEYPGKLHPVIYMGNYIKFLWGKRPVSRREHLFIWGIFISLSGGIVFALVSQITVNLFSGVLKILLSSFLLKAAFSWRALLSAAREVKKALEEDNLEEARRLTSYHLVSRDTENLTDDEICGAVIESVAENLTDSFISPLFYFALGGVPAAWSFRFINTCDSLLGYRKDDYEQGGKFAARLDDVLNWIPARLGGFLLVFSSFITGGDWRNSYSVMMSSHNETSSPNAGWTMAAMAGALHVKLEKKGEYVLHGGSDKLNFHLIESALRIVMAAMIFFTILTIGILEVLK